MPLSQARNDKEVLAMLHSPIAKAINYVIDKIYDENIGAIHDVVYMAYSPEEYERTGDFYRAWGAGTTKVVNERTVEGEFKYKPDKMSIGSTDPNSSNYGQHIGVAGKFKDEDARPYLAEIIYNGIKNGSAFGHGEWSKKRDAWEELNKRIGRRKMKQWMKEGLEAAGLKVQMHNKAIEVTTTKVD